MEGEETTLDEQVAKVEEVAPNSKPQPTSQAPSPDSTEIQANNQHEGEEPMKLEKPIPTYDQILAQCNISGDAVNANGTVKVIEILRKCVKVHDELAASDNSVIAQRDKGMVKLWISSDKKVKVGDTLKAEDKGINSSIIIS